MTQTFADEIEHHLAAIEDCCCQAGMVHWAAHVTLILGDPQDVQHTVIFGQQDLEGLLRLLEYHRTQAEARRQQELGKETQLP